MSRQRLTVVLSQAPGKHPAKRSLEESVAAALILEPGLDVSIVPNLYDLGPDHTGRLYLQGVTGDLLVFSWHFPRAAFWLLDRMGVPGKMGESLIKPASDEDDTETEPPEGIGSGAAIPDRHIYCIDLREKHNAEPYLAEVRRIAAECRDRRDEAQRSRPAAAAPLVQLGFGLTPKVPELPAFTPEQLLAPPNRRWYPVIDYSRCTNCLECLDFCLFGVYGVDRLDRILVESQDNCKKGCPACSRVCPEQAIMFPEYKTPAIAGAPVGEISGLKIDLSRLFGGEEKDAVSQAIAERDRELVADGRQAVGTAVGLAKRQPASPAAAKDDLDKLMDDLDALGL
ncbi:4Fe-4S dicluster domain-containing protein [Zavarzinella formosa]|uniref:4Fe-4S dicluster domain-containing protein n=1 Tax=Zavarzinella formosa TaxID=360055 RepID=UPI0002D57F55|nr:ferredoxin family protein [Zavarzinella formosa]